MNNSPQDKMFRWREPRLKKPWQRFLLILAIGLIMGLLIQWTLVTFDPVRVFYTRQWRQTLVKFMLEIAHPKTWFWIIFIFNLIMGILTEVYYYRIGIKSKK